MICREYKPCKAVETPVNPLRASTHPCLVFPFQEDHIELCFLGKTMILNPQDIWSRLSVILININPSIMFLR